jgi:small subunit ribosomal protein S16
MHEARSIQMLNRIKKEKFDLNDIKSHLKMMFHMEVLSTLLNFLPRAAKMKQHVNDMDDHQIKRQIAIIQSMTKKERRNPLILNASRQRCIAGGVPMAEVNRLVKNFEQMQTVMKKNKFYHGYAWWLVRKMKGYFMALKIRLARGGSKKRPFYRIVVAEATSPRDGRFVERVGSYNPLLAAEHPERIVLDQERIQYWLSVGAQPTDRVALFLGRASITDMPERRDNPVKAAPGKKAQERAKA